MYTIIENNGVETTFDTTQVGEELHVTISDVDVFTAIFMQDEESFHDTVIDSALSNGFKIIESKV